MLPFLFAFEGRKPGAREVVLLSALCAAAVAGRMAFGAIPQFKPVVALVIITGACLGGETGFLLGALTAFVSNFYFGQGPWTPWQMFAWGLIGFISGVAFRFGAIKSRFSLCVFGFLATLAIHGGIMNTATVLMMQQRPDWSMILKAMEAGLVFDLIHALSTAMVLWLAAEPMFEKLNRIKVKYGIF